jgi:hypothetical protein
VCAGVGEGSHARPWPLHLPIGPTRESSEQKPHRCSGMFSLRLSNQIEKMPAARYATRSVCKSRSGVSNRSMQRMGLFIDGSSWALFQTGQRPAVVPGGWQLATGLQDFERR